MKRKNVRRILALLALVFGMMVISCGGDESDTASYTPPTTPSTPTKPILSAPAGLAGDLVSNRITVTKLTAGTIYDFRVAAYTTDPLYLSDSEPLIVFSGYTMLTGIKANGRGRP